MRGQEEFRLTCVVADWLRLALPDDVPWSHFPAGESRSAITGARLKRMGLARGWADFLILCQGVPIAIELKVGKGRASEHQISFAAQWIGQGGQHFECRSLADVEGALRALGVPLKARTT